MFETPEPYSAQDCAFIIHPVLKQDPTGQNARSIEAVLEEAEGLVRAIDLDVLGCETLNISRISPATFLGKGQIQTLFDMFDHNPPTVVVVNCALSPVQQRNLERAWDVKVIDRTGLILEIFGARAQTKEGRLQVDLAALAYQRSRLVRSWTHLERQRGGAGFMGGPGETQIEIDRRLIDQKITRLKKQLETVRRTRRLGREARARIPYPIVALVGYTNAGKSTLFNHLTSADVFAEDLPFATLDPTMRHMRLPNGENVILSDTVGFITDLPTHLVESFRATLEQIVYADVIVHLIDVSRPDYEAQREDVIKILQDLGVEYHEDPRVLEVYNKIDMVSGDTQSDYERFVRLYEHVQAISAVTGQGVDEFISAVADILARNKTEETYSMPVSDGKALAWLYAHADVKNVQANESNISVRVLIDAQKKGQFVNRFGYNAL